MDKEAASNQAAIELFATQGFEKTSIAQVCETAKVSEGFSFSSFSKTEMTY
ncbi:TetR family transcriptional regulator [Vibrio lentus]|nr:TetR family transcriptional regulator [Vibrio lentus]